MITLNNTLAMITGLGEGYQVLEVTDRSGNKEYLLIMGSFSPNYRSSVETVEFSTATNTIDITEFIRTTKVEYQEDTGKRFLAQFQGFIAKAVPLSVKISSNYEWKMYY